MDEPIVSIIIPTYNRPRILFDTINNVLNQTLTNIKIIVIDDGSSEEMREIIQSFTDGRIHYIKTEENLGCTGARLLGIQSSEGDFIAFLDDDDEWLPEKLDIQLNLMEKEQSILSFTGKNIFINSNFQKYSFKNSYLWMLNFYNFVGTTSSIIISTDIIKSVRGFDVSLSQLQDYDLFLRIKSLGIFSGINRPLINYYLDKSDVHVSINWGNFFSSAYKVWLKQGVLGKFIFPIGLLITLLQKIKNAINGWRFNVQK